MDFFGEIRFLSCGHNETWSGVAENLGVEPLEELNHDLVAALGEPARRGGDELVLEAGQLIDELVARAIVDSARRCALGVDRREGLGPKAMAVGGAVGYRACHADRTDRVELVGIEQAGGFDGVGTRSFAKAMGLDGVTHRLDASEG